MCASRNDSTISRTALASVRVAIQNLLQKLINPAPWLSECCFVFQNFVMFSSSLQSGDRLQSMVVNRWWNKPSRLGFYFHAITRAVVWVRIASPYVYSLFYSGDLRKTGRLPLCLRGFLFISRLRRSQRRPFICGRGECFKTHLLTISDIFSIFVWIPIFPMIIIKTD